MRTSIDIDHRGIFLRGVEVHRFDEAVVEVCDAVSRLDASAGNLRHIIVLPRVFGIKENGRPISRFPGPFLGGQEGDAARYSRR